MLGRINYATYFQPLSRISQKSRGLIKTILFSFILLRLEQGPYKEVEGMSIL